MGDESDGDQRMFKEKMSAIKTKMPKKRSNSLELLTLSKAQVNKIIGFKDKNPIPGTVDDKQDGQKNGVEDKTSEFHTNIQGGSTTKRDYLLNTNEDKNKYEYVFKPKNIVHRTPPQEIRVTDQENNETQIISNKRLRSERESETSSENEMDLKRQCDRVLGRKKIEGSEVIEPLDVELSEEVVQQTLVALDKINEVTLNRYAEKEGFTREDQNCIREAHINLHKLFSMIIFKMGKLEKENLKLKYIVKSINQEKKTEDGDVTEIQVNRPSQHRVRTYAETANIVKYKTINNDIDKKIGTEHKQWNTPQTVKKLETIIKINDINEPEKAMQQLKKEINSQKTGGFKNVRQTKSGAIVIESHDKYQQEKLKTALKDKNNITFKEAQNINPMFMVTGIEKGITNEEFLEEIERLNYEIVNELGFKISDKIKIIAKRQCRNPLKENWILQAQPQIAKWFLKKGKINFDLVMVYVREHFNLAMCFKCCGFGHVSKYCKEKETCHKCGDEHVSIDCNIDKYKCPNCQKLKLTEINHSARDLQCPIYKRRLERYKNNIIYNDFL